MYKGDEDGLIHVVRLTFWITCRCILTKAIWRIFEREQNKDILNKLIFHVFQNFSVTKSNVQ